MTGAITFYVRSGTSPVPGAKVYINSPGMPIYQYIYKGYTSTYGVLSVPYLPAGTNRYMVSKTGYNVASGSTTVYDGRSVTVNVNMTKSLSTIGSMTGSLSIMSNPPGACVYINDSLQEMPTPVVINDIPEGDYVLTLVKEGYNDYITLITIVRGQTTISTDLIPI